MKKALKIMLTIVAAAFLFACVSQPETAGPVPQNPVEESLASAYERYAAGLILDGAERYTVVRGDTLSQIAIAKYPSGFYYPVIMLASRDIVLDPDRIAPGMVLTIPDIQRNLNNATARANIKGFLFDIAIIEEQRNRDQTAEGIRTLANSL